MKNLLAAISVAALTVTAQASAQDIEVQVEAWMLETEEGAERVYKMLERRVKRACDVQSSSTRIKVGAKECREDLMAQLVDELNSDNVTALYMEDKGIRLAEVQ